MCCHASARLDTVKAWRACRRSSSKATTTTPDTVESSNDVSITSTPPAGGSVSVSSADHWPGSNQLDELCTHMLQWARTNSPRGIVCRLFARRGAVMVRPIAGLACCHAAGSVMSKSGGGDHSAKYSAGRSLSSSAVSARCRMCNMASEWSSPAVDHIDNSGLGRAIWVGVMAP